jgi:hypothetical protein
VSLSQEPAFSSLKNFFVCGTHDISNEPYCGVSGRHESNGQAINTTNGAGPHNIQLFMLSADGTVLNVLPGYWNPRDLVTEMRLAYDLNRIWQDGTLSRGQKETMFRQAHLNHVNQHPLQMVMRSRMQGFDQEYEFKHRFQTSDTIKDPQLVLAAYQSGDKMAAGRGFKTTDEIFHERLSTRPFTPYNSFDVASYVDYGRPYYDKHEDQRDLTGTRVTMGPTPMIGDVEKARAGNKRMRRQQRMQQRYRVTLTSHQGNGVVNYP